MLRCLPLSHSQEIWGGQEIAKKISVIISGTFFVGESPSSYWGTYLSCRLAIDATQIPLGVVKMCLPKSSATKLSYCYWYRIYEMNIHNKICRNLLLRSVLAIHMKYKTSTYFYVSCHRLLMRPRWRVWHITAQNSWNHENIPNVNQIRCNIISVS